MKRQALEAIAAGTAEPCWVADTELEQLSFANRAYERLFGVACGARGFCSSLEQRILPEYRAAYRQELGRRRAGSAGELAYRARCLDGSIRWFSDSASFAGDDRQTLVGFLRDRTLVWHAHGLAQDLTHRESAMGDSGVGALVSALGIAVGADYASVATVLADDRTAETTALDLDGELREPIRYQLPGTPCERVMAQEPCTYARGLQEAFPTDRVLVDMGLHAYLGTPLFAQSGEVLGLVNLLYRRELEDTDFFDSLLRVYAVRIAAELERGRAERALLAVQEADAELRVLNLELESRVDARTDDLARANADLESFCYSISHDLRAPLRAINGYSQAMIEDSSELSEETLNLLGRSRRNAEQMASLLDDLLAFARSGRAALTIADVDPAIVISEALSELAPDRSQVSITVGDLPIVRADARLLKQVWLNLIGNAIKFSSCRAEAMVEVGGRREGDSTLSWIKDNGVGFDARHQEKIFGVFERCHPDYEGTGVGLAIVERVIIRHGGRVWATSEPGAGASFFFALPS